MSLPIIQPDDTAFAKEVLASFYGDELIPAEKKDFLTDLSASVGPYLGVKTRDGGTRWILDVASQITTLGLGFSVLPLFGVAHHPESWLNRPDTAHAKDVRRAFDALLTRQLGWERVNTHLCSAGAEANEIALGECFRLRKIKDARTVLAFEGAFHGRMTVTLAATHNAAKRVPFEWPRYQAAYCPFPEIKTALMRQVISAEWRHAWSVADAAGFAPPSAENDAVLTQEVASLLSVRTALLTGRIFAVIVEPMQCEGGDRYATDRFFTALLLMCRAFAIPIVMDEVQTGFHLSPVFFWHRLFDLHGLDGETLAPDYVTCAKKAQVGVVLSHAPITLAEAPCFASLCRGYIQGMVLAQGTDKIKTLEKLGRAGLDDLAVTLPGKILNPRASGLAFAFDVATPAICNQLVGKRFAYGLMFYPAGDRTLRFRLNLSFTPDDVGVLFERLTALCRDVMAGEENPWSHPAVLPAIRPADALFRAHAVILDAKLGHARGASLSADKLLYELAQTFAVDGGAMETRLLTRGNFPEHSTAIAALQEKAFEPARRTPLAKFARAFAHPRALGLGIFSAGNLVGISVAAPLKLFPDERLVDEDPDYDDENCLYVLDTTVHPDFQGKAYGQFLRYALHLTALAHGVKRLNGRNRDQIARQMLAINLSLGAYEIRHGVNDYPDDLPHRDVIYYASLLPWSRASAGATGAWSHEILTPEFIVKNLAPLVNKVTLSNFVSRDFLDNVKFLFSLLPAQLQHGYTASGEAEGADKIAKSIRFHGRLPARFLTFDGCYFGNGSFLARSLSFPDDPYYPVIRLPYPDQTCGAVILSRVEEALVQGDVQSVWIEPLTQHGAKRAPREFLHGLRGLCDHYKTPLVYNETAAQGYRYDAGNYFASGEASIRPDLGMVFLGGQAGLAFTRREFFVSAPLMMISTWDGDEYSFSAAAESARRRLVKREAQIDVPQDTLNEI